MSIISKINWAMSLREPQYEALQYFDAISSNLDYKIATKEKAEKVATENCEDKKNIKVDKEFHFPSFCFDMTTGIGKTRLMGAAIYYLYKTKGYKHFFILTPGNTIYDKLRKETVPSHPKYMFKGLETEMGRPKVYDGENYLSYPVKFEQGEIIYEKTSEIQLFIFNIGKIFTRGDVSFKFHDFNENLGGSFADVLKKFDDLVICMDEAHRYYAPASMKAIDYLNPILGLEFTATPKDSNKNIIYRYDLAKGAGKYLKIPVVMGRTNTAGYSADDIEEMKLKDGIKLHERRKAVVYKYCVDNNLEQVKPIVLVACKDTTHAKKVREKIDADSFFAGKYVGKVIQIDSSTGTVETEENIQKLLTIEENTNPIEIVLHVYKLKEGWDVNNLFTIIPLNAAKSDILALQTIGRGLRLPFGQITGVEEVDTLDIVAHDHYREIIDDIKDNPIFKSKDLDKDDIPDTTLVEINTSFENEQLSLVDTAIQETKVKSFQDFNDARTVESIYKSYLSEYAKKITTSKMSKDNQGQLSLFDLDPTAKTDTETPTEPSGDSTVDTEVIVSAKTKKPIIPALKKEEFEQKLKQLSQVAISVPKISINYSSTITFKPVTVKRNHMEFDVAASQIERYDVINERLLSVVEADALIEDEPENALACMLLEEIPEFSADDAEYILDVVNQYMSLIEGDYEQKKKIIRRYATVIINDLKKQIYAAKEEHTEFIHQVQKDLILFGRFVKNMRINGKVNFKKEVDDKKNIRQYLFEGYKKSYYPENSFDSDDERRLAVILEDDSEVLKFIKPPLNQLGLFYKAGKQYNPDFLVETKDAKYMIEVKASNRTADEDVLEKAHAAIKWCECATSVDSDSKEWRFRLIPGEDIVIGSTFKYTAGKAVVVEEEQ
ncbi:MAG TPA: DEAD/DEAH box helicase family protein [Clostridiales bacterium]|nr:DEAD/DEAH box helicase family protein [Clostridiales bacterium]